MMIDGKLSVLISHQAKIIIYKQKLASQYNLSIFFNIGLN